MAAPIVIRSTDLGAPVLSGVEGSLAAIIRYAAPLLDWDIIFDAGTKIVIRAKTGSRLYVRINDTAARGGSAPRIAEVRAYESMSNIDTGAGLVGPSYLSKSDEANTNSREYIIVGDGTFFSMCHCFFEPTWTDYAYNGSYWGFGDGIKAFPFIDYSPFVLFGGADNTAFPKNLIYVNLYGTKSAFFLHRSVDGSQLNVPSALIANSGMSLSYLGYTVHTGKPVYPYNGQLLLGQPVTGQGSDNASGLIHTYIPGLYDPLHSSGFTTASEIVSDSDTYFPFRYTYNSSYGCGLLKLTGDFRS